MKKVTGYTKTSDNQFWPTEDAAKKHQAYIDIRGAIHNWVHEECPRGLSKLGIVLAGIDHLIDEHTGVLIQYLRSRSIGIVEAK